MWLVSDKEHRIHPRDQIHARGDHRSRVDQRAKPGSGPPSRPAATRAAGTARSCRPLRRTAAARPSPPAESPTGRCARPCSLSRFSKIPVCPNRSNDPVYRNSRISPARNPTSPTRVTKKRLLRRAHRRGLLEPEPDQQIRGQPDQLPAHEHQQDVVRDHKRQHRRREQRQIREVARDSACRRACSRWSRSSPSTRRPSRPAASRSSAHRRCSPC